VQGAGYFRFEVEIDTADLELENDAAARELETDVAAI
jgi:hypothetical protein